MLKQFKFTVENHAGERTSFRGDGATLEDAWKDAVKNLQRQDAIGVSVLKGVSWNNIETMTLAAFEARSFVKTEEPDFE